MTDPRPGEPPFLLDGAHVVRYATIDRSIEPPAHFNVVAAGVPMHLDVVAGLAVAEDLVHGGVYLLHCNDDWQTVAAETFADADDAQRSAEERYEGVAVTWQRYRALTESERGEVETTRRFLREIAAEFPGE